MGKTININAQVKMEDVPDEQVPESLFEIEERISFAIKADFGLDVFGGTVKVVAQVIE